MTPEINARDAKLIQYLNEAYGKEKQLETALEAHIAMTTRDAYRKRLKDHLRETKSHAREVGRRIKQLGGKAESVTVPGPEGLGDAASKVAEVAQRGVALAQGPLHAVRGTGDEEKQLKNAKDEYSDEAQEIATYTAIEALASAVGDRQTAQLARTIRGQEERMAGFLQRLIPQLTKAVAQAEIPASQRSSGSRSRTTTSRRSTGARKTTARRTTAKKTARRTTGRKTTARKTTARKTTGRKTTGRKTTARRTTGRKTTGRKATARRTTGRKTTARRSTGRKTTARRTTGRRTTTRASSRSRPTRGRTTARRTKARRSTGRGRTTRASR